MGAAHRLAVDGHHFALGELGHGLNPLNETMLELLRIQPGEDVSEGIMGGNTVGQLQEGLEPLLFAVAEELDIHPVIGAADGATNGNGDDIQEFVPLGASILGSSNAAKYSTMGAPVASTITTTPTSQQDSNHFKQF